MRSLVAFACCVALPIALSGLALVVDNLGRSTTEPNGPPEGLGMQTLCTNVREVREAERVAAAEAERLRLSTSGGSVRGTSYSGGGWSGGK